jgi:hypothetical protein
VLYNNRVEITAELLSSTAKPAEFRVLHCTGFYHDPTCHDFGLVYDFPVQEAIVCHLWTFLDDFLALAIRGTVLYQEV